jgi:predicted DNA-binding transcriptional regulator AlpA
MSSPETSPRLLRLAEVTRLTSLQRSAIYHRMEHGLFPQAVRISSRCTVWHESEILAWIEALPRGVGARPGSPPAASAA